MATNLFHFPVRWGRRRRWTIRVTVTENLALSVCLFYVSRELSQIFCSPVKEVKTRSTSQDGETTTQQLQHFFRCPSISWFQVVSERLIHLFLQLGHLRVFQIFLGYIQSFNFKLTCAQMLDVRSSALVSPNDFPGQSRGTRYPQDFHVVKIDKNDFKVQPLWGEQVPEKPKSNAASVW